MSKVEKCWVLTHPFAAYKAKKVNQYVLKTVDSLRRTGILDTFLSGGKLDAFRHIYWMCHLSKKIGAKKAEAFGRVHEVGNYQDFLNAKLEDGQRPDSLSTVMDLRNNALGIQLFKESKALNIPFLIEYIYAGNTYELKRNKGVLVNCNNETVDIKKYKAIWYVPYCLIKSNEE